MLSFLRDTLAAMTELDGPLLASLRKLVLRPGSLSVDFVQGRWATIVHPAKLFVAVALLALLPRAVVQNDLELGGFVYILTAGVASAVGHEWAQALVLLVAAPIMALALAVLYRRQKRRFFEHLVVTTEFFTLVLLVGTVETAVVILAGGGEAQLYAAIGALGTLVLAGGATLRRFYGASLVEAAVGVVYLGACAACGLIFSVDFF